MDGANRAVLRCGALFRWLRDGGLMSPFVWLDDSERERRKMIDVVDLFREHDTRNEREGVQLTCADMKVDCVTTGKNSRLLLEARFKASASAQGNREMSKLMSTCKSRSA